MVWLDTVITSAPLLGILGTVLGIIDSFELLAARSDVDPLAVSGGVSEALITTATGLVIALLVIFPYNVFRARLRIRLESLERAALAILAETPEAEDPQAAVGEVQAYLQENVIALFEARNGFPTVDRDIDRAP